MFVLGIFPFERTQDFSPKLIFLALDTLCMYQTDDPQHNYSGYFMTIKDLEILEFYKL